MRDKEEIKRIFNDFCEKRGLSLSFSGNACTQKLTKFELERGEIFLDTHKNELLVSEKKQKIGEVSYFLSFHEKEKREIPLDEKMRRLWGTYTQRMVVGEVAKIILPKAHASLFIALKPENFSTLEGESLQGSFFENKGWIYAPDGRGKFVQTGGNENAEIKKDNVASHSHPAIVHHLLENTHSILASDTVGAMSVMQEVGRVGNLQTQDMEKRETRPKNIAILSIWKIGE